MKAITLLPALFLYSCASTRTLSEQERLSLGLTGIIYDARICHRSFDASSNELQADQPCEIVSCEPGGKNLVCKARPLTKEDH